MMMIIFTTKHHVSRSVQGGEEPQAHLKRCSLKKQFWKSLQKSQNNTDNGVFFTKFTGPWTSDFDSSKKSRVFFWLFFELLGFIEVFSWHVNSNLNRSWKKIHFKERFENNFRSATVAINCQQLKCKTLNNTTIDYSFRDQMQGKQDLLLNKNFYGNVSN